MILINIAVPLWEKADWANIFLRFAEQREDVNHVNI